MSQPSATAMVPIIVLIAIVAMDLWVYRDAKAHAARGTPVVFASGTFAIDTPELWFLGCLILWLFFFPLYVLSRRRDG